MKRVSERLVSPQALVREVVARGCPGGAFQDSSTRAPVVSGGNAAGARSTPISSDRADQASIAR